jgi:hypothetical protein
MRNILALILVSILFPYLGVSFVELNLNFLQWGEGARAAVLVFSMLIFTLLGSVL